MSIGRKKATAQSKMIDLRDPRVREEFLIGEMTAANQKMMEGTYPITISATPSPHCMQATLKKLLDIS